MQIVIKPFDTLFFRDGKPFEMGEENLANTQILPNPETIWGAILSTYLSQNPDDFEKLDNLKRVLKINFISLIDLKNNNLLFNFPLDIVRIKESGNRKIKLHMDENTLITSPYKNLNLLISKSNEAIDNVNGLMKEYDFLDYLENYEEGINSTEVSDFYFKERKIGIARDNTTKSVIEGRIYRISLIRLTRKSMDIGNNIGIFVEFEGLELDDKGFIKLGGENKIAYYEKIDDKLNDIENISFDLKKYFKVIFLTPSIPNKYFLPEKFYYSYKNKEYVEIRINEDELVKVKLVGMILPKHKQIGGFDLEKAYKKDNPIKSMYKVIPEGSIFYFETEKNFEKIKKAFHLKSFSDFKKNKGFGICVIGNYENSY